MREWLLIDWLIDSIVDGIYGVSGEELGIDYYGCYDDYSDLNDNSDDYSNDYNDVNYFYADLISLRLKALNCDSRNWRNH